MQPTVEDKKQSGTVLVIDDHPQILETVSEILDMEGIIALTASNGENGIQLFVEQQSIIDLILLDLTMPGISGTETLQRLRLIDSDIPIILMTGRSLAEAAEKINEGDATGFLAKPYSWEQLMEIVWKHLGSD